MSNPLRVRARVSLTVEVLVSDTWDGDVKMDQIKKQASERAINMFIHCRKEGKLPGLEGVLVDKVLAILVDET